MAWITPETESAYVAVPHAASTSIITWLRRRWPRTYCVGAKHSLELPEGFGDRIWTVTRHPWSRLVGMWQKQGKAESLAGRICEIWPGHYETSLKRYVEALVAQEHPAFRNHRRLVLIPQTEFLGQDFIEKRLKWIFDFQRIPWNFVLLPWVEEGDEFLDFPWLNYTRVPRIPRNRVPIARNHPEIAELVREWAQGDADLLDKNKGMFDRFPMAEDELRELRRQAYARRNALEKAAREEEKKARAEALKQDEEMGA